MRPDFRPELHPRSRLGRFSDTPGLAPASPGYPTHPAARSMRHLSPRKADLDRAQAEVDRLAREVNRGARGDRAKMDELQAARRRLDDLQSEVDREVSGALWRIGRTPSSPGRSDAPPFPRGGVSLVGDGVKMGPYGSWEQVADQLLRERARGSSAMRGRAGLTRLRDLTAQEQAHLVALAARRAAR